MEHKENNLIHISLLVILVLVFFGLMFLSTTNKNLETKYTFFDEVKINENNYNVKIGELYVKNTGRIASKISVDSYKGCIFDDSTLDYQYGFDISYAGSTTNYNDFTNSQRQSIEVGSKDEKTFGMTLNGFYPYQTKFDDKGVPVTSNTTKNYNLYIFKIKPTESDYYNYCVNAQKADAIKIIKLTSE